MVSLRKRVAEYEKNLGKAYTAAVSTLAQDVSRDLPDDIVKNDISRFFQGDFLSWCADMCAVQITQQEYAAERLRSIGIINDSQAHRHAPRYLQFDMNMSDGSSPLVLLQAVLATELCETFLTNPYFLVEEQQGLKEFETKLSASK